MKRVLAVMTLALCATVVSAQVAAPAAPQPSGNDLLIAQGGPAPEVMAAPSPDPQGPGAGFERRGPGGPGMAGPGPMKFWANSEVAAKINLTDQQKQQLETTFTNYRLKLIAQRAAVEREQVKLEPLVQADKLDEGAITKQIDALIAARGQLEKTTAMMRVDIRKVLTTEQWKQLKEMHRGMAAGRGEEVRERMRQEFRERRERRPGGAGQTPPPPPGDQDNPK